MARTTEMPNLNVLLNLVGQLAPQIPSAAPQGYPDLSVLPPGLKPDLKQLQAQQDPPDLLHDSRSDEDKEPITPMAEPSIPNQMAQNSPTQGYDWMRRAIDQHCFVDLKHKIAREEVQPFFANWHFTQGLQFLKSSWEQARLVRSIYFNVLCILWLYQVLQGPGFLLTMVLLTLSSVDVTEAVRPMFNDFVAVFHHLRALLPQSLCNVVPLASVWSSFVSIIDQRAKSGIHWILTYLVDHVGVNPILVNQFQHAVQTFPIGHHVEAICISVVTLVWKWGCRFLFLLYLWRGSGILLSGYFVALAGALFGGFIAREYAKLKFRQNKQIIWATKVQEVIRKSIHAAPLHDKHCPQRFFQNVQLGSFSGQQELQDPALSLQIPVTHPVVASDLFFGDDTSLTKTSRRLTLVTEKQVSHIDSTCFAQYIPRELRTIIWEYLIPPQGCIQQVVEFLLEKRRWNYLLIFDRSIFVFQNTQPHFAQLLQEQEVPLVPIVSHEK